MPNIEQNTNITNEEVVLEDNQLICALTNEVKPAKSKELTLQSLISMLNEEYGFDLTDMERDFNITYVNDDGKNKRMKIDLALFEAGKTHNSDNLIRICIVQDEKTKDKDDKRGVEAILEAALAATNNCEFGVWTNGKSSIFFRNILMIFTTPIIQILPTFPEKGKLWKIWRDGQIK